MTNAAELARERHIKLLCLPFIIMGLLHLGLAFASLPAFVQRMSTLSIEPYLLGATQTITNETVLQAAAIRGMSLDTYAIYQAIFNGGCSLFFVTLAGVILWKAHQQFFGWYTAMVMIMLSSYPLVDAIRQAHPLPTFLLEGGSVSWPLYILFFFVFPNGREEPRWMRWPVGFLLLFHLFLQLLGVFYILYPVLKDFFYQFLSIGQISITVNTLIILGSQVYRYRTVSTPIERQQTKIFLASLIILLMAAFLIDPILDFPFKAELNTLELLFAPLAVAISIMRYRLWDIDLIIRRTLLYAMISGLLGLVYYGSVVVLNQLLKGLTGESTFALVISTLLIAALFNPLRRRLQVIIDQRFYRPKYDAEHTLEGFSEVVRNEVELAVITKQLTWAVNSTIQPKDFGLWIRPMEATTTTRGVYSER